VWRRRSSGPIRDIERPHDLEALEYGEDIVVYLEALTRRLPGEIAAMGSDPPVSCAGPFPLIPSERLVDFGQRLDRHLGGSPDEPRTPFAVWHDDEIAGLWHLLTTFAIPGEQSPEKGQAICGLSGTTPPNRKISPLLSGAYSFSTRSPMGELASRKRVGSNRIIHRSAVSDPGKLS
jgi:hypothetical protein